MRGLGSSLRVESARITEKELKESGASGVSTPPAITTRAPPNLIRRKASPIAT